MSFILNRMRPVAGVFLLGASVLCGQDWKTSESLPGVDFSGLTPAQKASVLKVMREDGCSCGCNMKVAECRIADPGCSYSTGLAKTVVEAIRAGKSESDALAAANASRYAHPVQPKLLADPVSIPIKGAPYEGRENAPITMVEFSDFQCPYCAQAVPQIEGLLHMYPQQIKLVFKQFPLETHPRADFAAAASVAAQKQGKFWQMHDALFANRDNLSRENILAVAKNLGLDVKRFEDDLDSTAVRESVTRDSQDGDKAGVEGTPTIFINGQKFNGPIELTVLKPIVDEQLKKPAISQASAAR